MCDGKFHHVKNGVENGKFHVNFALLGRSAETLRRDEASSRSESQRALQAQVLLQVTVGAMISTPLAVLL